MREELNEIMNEIQTTNYSDVGSIDLLIEYGFKLSQHIARSGQLMSESKEQLHNARRIAYKTAEGILKDRKSKYSPLLLKDYINDCCAEENSLYELAERTNRACTHQNSLIITAISALKNERFAASFSTT